MKKDKIKLILKYVLGAGIGYYIVGELFISIFFTPLIINFKFLDFNYINLSQYQTQYQILDWLIAGVGVLLGIYVTKKQNILYKIFTPQKQNLIPNLIFSIILIIAFFIKERVLTLYYAPLEQIKFIFINIPWNILLSIAYFHPFFALLHFIFPRIKHKNFKNMWLWIVLVILLNPAFLMVASGIDKSIEFKMFNRPCGVGIIELIKDFPAEKSGMLVGDIITQVDDIEVVEETDFVHYVQGLKEPKELTVFTNKGSYKITPKLHKESGNYWIGIYYGQEYCK